MTPPLFIDIELARALEGGEAACSAAFCLAAARLYPDLGIQVWPCAGGSAQFYGPSHPLNAVKGVGLNGPVDVRAWDALEQAYRASGSPVVIDLCPLADEAFVAMLGERGYRIGSFETVTCRRLDRAALLAAPPTSGVTIDVIGGDRAEEWGRVINVGFADGGEPFSFGFDLGRVRASTPHSVMLLAEVDGAAAGGAALSTHEGLALMAGAAVIPAYRRRGIQQALTAARLRLAAERGCTLAKIDVRAGSGSYRNAVRAGFQVAYTRPQMVRSW